MMTDAVRILVVDDDPIAVSILCNALGDIGTIHVATSGAAALQLAAAYPIDLVLLDIVMPTMDGFATCRALRRDHPDLRIVFLTVANKPDVEVQALAAGGHDFIGKPINPLVVRASVALHLELQAQETARKRIEDKLCSITDAAHDAIILMNPQGAISFWNPAATRMLGYTAAEVLGKNLHDLLAPDRYLAAHRAALPEFQSTGRGTAMGKTIELSAKRNDGQEITVDVSLSTIASDDGWHSVGILRDVTERKRIAERLRLSEERLRLLTDNAIDNLWTMGADGTFFYSSPSIEKLAGYTPAEMRQVSLDVILTDDSLARANEYLERLNADLRAGRPLEVFRGELELRRRDGSIVWTEVIASPLCDSNGRFVELVGVTRDITGRRRLEAELHKG